MRYGRPRRRDVICTASLQRKNVFLRIAHHRLRHRPEERLEYSVSGIQRYPFRCHTHRLCRYLVKVSGLGKKTAEKIVLELKDKIGGFAGGEMTAGMLAGMLSDMDAIEALKALGYEADEAREALKKIPAALNGKETDTGAKVKAALKELGK